MKEDRRKVHEVEYRLAMELKEYLCGNWEGKVRWTDTRMHLMEVIHYLYQEDLMKDEMGMSVSKKCIAMRACQVFDVTMPCNMSTYLTRMRNNKGVRSRLLVDENLYNMTHYGEYFGLKRSVVRK